MEERFRLAVRNPGVRVPSRTAAIASLEVLLLAALACTALEPALASMAVSAPASPEPRSWSVVQIAKPTQRAVSATAVPTAQATATEFVEAQEAPTATAEEPALITMVIVEDSDAPLSESEAAEATDPGGKYVLVSIGEQRLYAYENGQLVFDFVASTGMGNSTRVGTFHVLDKIPNAYGANWNIWMPNWMGIYWSGSLENGIHALPILPGGARLWAGFLGTPISYGCVVLGIAEAQELYDWADVGTPVEIRW